MFNKKLCIENIYALAKTKGIRIGDLEEKAGVSKGYLSRINRDDSTSIPTIDLLASIADQLGVGIDFLVNYPIGAMTPNEDLVYQFIDKLIVATYTNKVDWIIESQGVLCAENNEPVENPLVTVTKNYSVDADLWYDTHSYTSGLFNEGHAEINGNCYHAVLPTSGATVYLNSVRYHLKKESGAFVTGTSDVIEVYIVSKSLKPICSSYYVCGNLSKAIEELYRTVSTFSSHIGLENTTKNIMKDFIESIKPLDDSNYDGELPY